MTDKSRRRSASHRTFSENKQLRRENARLKKMVSKLNGAINSMAYKGFTAEEDLDQEEAEKQTLIKDLTPENTCKKCGSGKIGEVNLGAHIYMFCSDCSYRERKSS